MKTYTKILIFFKKINIHRSSISPSEKDSFAYNFVFSYSKNKANLNLNKTLISLYSTLKVVQLLDRKASILFVGNSDNILFFDIMKKKTNNIFFIQKWIPGILSNWDRLELVVKSQSQSFIKQSYKLRFFRFFYNTFTNKKPNLVIICGNLDNKLIASECYNQGIPVISLGYLNKLTESSITYQVPANIKTFLSSSLFLQLYLGQTFTINNDQKKTKV